MSSRQIKNAQRRGIIEFYLRPRKIWKILTGRAFPLKYLLYGGFVIFLIMIGYITQPLNGAKRKIEK